ncbi:MAG TPA: FHA domain-containing protein, partial [Thermoguttaceae bacterium]|nr:FHA domain-containing protein [Thermoguttaceae bacterium]
MARITLQIIDGADRGKVFLNTPTPVTVGREEGNVVQLNDERVSRFHLKIQEDEGQIVLTDLESTNGTRVNGEYVKICNLRPGDVIMVGRTVLLFGSREEIAQRLAILRG